MLRMTRAVDSLVGVSLSCRPVAEHASSTRRLVGPITSARRVVAAHPDVACAVLVILVAVALRVAFFPRAPVFIHGDSYQYYRPADALMNAQGFPLPLKRPPVYPLFVGLAGTVLGEDLRVLVAVQHLLGVVTAALAYGVGRLTFGWRVGLLSGLATALSGGHLIYEHYVLSEAVFTVLLTLGVFLFVAGLRQHSMKLCAGAGLAIGLATLTRPHAQLLLIAAPVLVALWCRRRSPAVRSTAVAFLAAAVLVVPWMARNYAVHGLFTVAGSSGQPLIDLTANHHAGKFVFYDSDNPPEGLDSRGERARRFIQRRVEDKVRNPSSNIMGITIQGWLMRELSLGEVESDALMREIALEAIRARPLTYARVVIEDSGRILMGVPDELTDHWRGHHRTLRDSDNPPPRGLRPLVAVATPEQEQGLWLTERLVSLYQAPRFGPVMPALFAIGLLAGIVVPTWRLALAPALAVLVLHAGSAATVGFVARYHHPPEPLMHVVAFGGVLALGHLLVSFLARLRGSARRGAAVQGGALPQ